MKFFTVFIFLNFVFFWVFSAQANHPSAASKIPVQSDLAEQPIWQIRDSNEKELGAGFFIGKRRFVTNAQIIYTTIKENNIKSFYLSQEGNPSVIKVKKVSAISALLDLTVWETVESVSNYLSLRDHPPQSSEQLSVPVYSRTFKTIRTIGDVLYENSLFYAFPFDHLNLEGIGGPPLLDKQGQVVGVIVSGTHNILHAIKIDLLKKFTIGEIGLSCASFVSATICIQRELKNLKKAAEDGDPSAQFKLAQMYYYAEGTEQDSEQAFYWYNKAAEQDFAPAKYELSVLYYNGEGTEQVSEQAFYWCKQAAEQGYTQARYNLAMMYKEGIGTEQNFRLAFEELKLPAAQGFIPAQFQLAKMYEEGQGTKKDLKQAFYWYNKAAEQKDPKAQFKVGQMYKTGQGTKKNLKQASHWYEEAAEQGHAEAQYQLAEMYRKGQGTEQNLDWASHWYEEAAEQGHAEAQFQLAEMYEEGRQGTEQNFELAFYWRKQATEQGHAKARNQLAKMYKEGIGTEQNLRAALVLLTSAAEQGDHPDQNSSLALACKDEFTK